MQQTVISVAWSNGRWQVTESGPRNAISCFGERQDAMDYAMAVAGRAGGPEKSRGRPHRPGRRRPEPTSRS